MTAATISSSRKIYLRAAVGLGILALLAVPASVHSVAALGTLRNLPAEWLPEHVPTRIDFYRFFRQFNVTDVVMVSWPDATLPLAGDDRSSLRDVVRLLVPLTEPAGRPEGLSAEPQPKWAAEFYSQARQASRVDYPLSWVRSGEEMLLSMTSRPLNLSRAAAIDRLRGNLIGPDGSQTCVVVSLSPDTQFSQRELLPMLRAAIARRAEFPLEEVAMVGGPVDGAAIDSESFRSIDRYTIPSTLLAGALCFWCLRSLPLTAVIVAIAVVGQGLGLALVYYSGQPLNAILIVLPPLIFVLTVSAGIHLSNYYLDLCREDSARNPDENALLAMRRGVPPCLIAAGTTVAGLCSLLLIQLAPVQLFGAAASIVLLVTLGLLLLTLPAGMILTRNPHASDGAALAVFFQTLAVRIIRRRGALLAFACLVGVVVALGLTRVRTTVSVPAMFPDGSDLRRQYEWFEAHVGPTATCDLLLTYPVDESEPLDRLRQVTQVHNALVQTEGVGSALSAATFTPPLSHKGGTAAIARRAIVAAQIEQTHSSLYGLGYLVQEDREQTWRISIKMRQAGEAGFKGHLARVRAAAENAIANSDAMCKPTAIALTGHVALVEDSQQIMLAGLLNSFIAALGLILVIMVISLRSIPGGSLAMLPNLMPAATLFGVMGWLDMPLDIGSVMTASVALGIAIDDTAHLLSRFIARRRAGLPSEQAATQALSQCGGAMMHTTLVCGFSLLVYALSDFLPTQRFAWFMFGMLAIALVNVTVLLPAMMVSRAGRYLARPQAARGVIESKSQRETAPDANA